MTDTKIYITTCTEKDDFGHEYTAVSHGVGNNTMRNYAFPWVPLADMPGVKQDTIGRYLEVENCV